MKHLVLASLLIGITSPVKANIEKNSSRVYSNQTHKVWCGAIDLLRDKKSDRPKCKINFHGDRLVIQSKYLPASYKGILEISNSQLTNVKLNQVCISSPVWETCKLWVNRLSDKRYTISFKDKEGRNREAVITVRDHSLITGLPNKLFKTFKSDLEQWMGKPISNIGPLIKYVQ